MTSAERGDSDDAACLHVEMVTMARLPGDLVVDRVQIGHGTRYRVWLRGELIHDYEERGDALVFIHRWITACDAPAGCTG